MQITRSTLEPWQVMPEPARAASTESGFIKTTAANLRRRVSLKVGSSPAISDHLTWLSNNGYSREDSRQIRYITEVFYNCEPMFSIACALATFGGLAITAELNCGCLGTDLTYSSAEQERHTTVHAFFRSLGAWPRYGEMLTRELSHLDAFPELVKATAENAYSIASTISTNNARPAGGFPDSLITSCEVVVVTCTLRQMFINAETARRTG